MTWALWLGVPVVATVLAAIWSWWRGVRARGPRRLSTRRAIQAHGEYLEALVLPARSAGRARREPAPAEHANGPPYPDG